MSLGEAPHRRGGAGTQRPVAAGRLNHGAVPEHRPLLSGNEVGRPILYCLKPMLSIPMVGLPVADGPDSSGGMPSMGEQV